MSRRRRPTDDDLDLWQRVAETVKPLKRTAPLAPKPAARAAPAKSATPAKPAKPTVVAPPPRPKQTAPSLPSLNPLERRMRSRVQRGILAIDARIDLHGLTQSAAHQRLIRFLRDAQADGARLVLVITGKGRPGDDYGGSERGVLRRAVPQWLASPELRRMVIGFEPAGRGHGGEGALYVRIRRPG